MRFIRLSPGLAKLVAPLTGLVVVAALAVPAIYWAERSSLAVWARKAERFEPKKGGRAVYHSPGVKSPPAISAADAHLADDEPVIGVEAAGKHRAYHQRSMSSKDRHVVNDLVGGKAVTVTFCDLNDCARGFGGEDASGPLDVALAGLADGGMLLSVGDVAYYQGTAELADKATGKTPARLPYPSFPVTRTTWGEWKALHPDTDLYIYRPPLPSAAEPPAPGTPGR